MTYDILNPEEWPAGLSVSQAIANINLSSKEITKKYGIPFAASADDLSSVQISLLRSSGGHFLILARDELPETKTSLMTTDAAGDFELHVKTMLREFLAATYFELSDLEQIWDFIENSDLLDVR